MQGLSYIQQYSSRTNVRLYLSFDIKITLKSRLSENMPMSCHGRRLHRGSHMSARVLLNSLNYWPIALRMKHCFFGDNIKS